MAIVLRLTVPRITASHFILVLGWMSLISIGSIWNHVDVRAQEQDPLTIFCWRGYVPKSVTQAFTNETGIHVVVEYYNSNEELLRYRLVNRQYDLVQPSDYALEALIDRNALTPLRKNRIPNLSNLDPEYQQPPYDPDEKFSVPWMSGTVGIVVDTSKVNEPVLGYADVFSGKYRGRIVALTEAREWLGWALMHLELPVNDVTPEVLDRVRDVWEEWMPQVAVFDSDTAANVMLAGKADIALTWSGDAAILLAASPKYKFILPKEGAHRFVDCLAIPQGSDRRDEAEDFMNFILRPEISLMISAELPFTNPNQAAYRRLSTAARSNPASYPQGNPDLRSYLSIGDMGEQVEKLYNDLRFGRSNLSGTGGMPLPAR